MYGTQPLSVTFNSCTITFGPNDQGAITVSLPFGTTYSPGQQVVVVGNLNIIHATGSCDPSQWQLTVAYYTSAYSVYASHAYQVMSTPILSFTGTYSFSFTAPTDNGQYTVSVQIQPMPGGGSCVQNCGIATTTFTVSGTFNSSTQTSTTNAATQIITTTINQVGVTTTMVVTATQTVTTQAGAIYPPTIDLKQVGLGLTIVGIVVLVIAIILI